MAINQHVVARANEATSRDAGEPDGCHWLPAGVQCNDSQCSNNF